MANNYFFIVAFLLFLLVFASGIFVGEFYLAKNPGANDNSPATTISLQKLPEQKLSSSINIVAVTSNGQGVQSKGDVEILSDGKGRVLFNTNPFVEPDTQQSLETAAFVAASFTKKSLADKDIIYSVSDSQAQLIGGPSAGAAFTVATIAAIEGKTIRADAAITGTIQADGSIGQIGGVVEKMNAVLEQKGKLFLIPKGQGTVTVYSEEVERSQRGNFVFETRRLIPKQIDLVELAKQEGLEVREISNIQEAVAVLLE